MHANLAARLISAASALVVTLALFDAMATHAQATRSVLIAQTASTVVASAR